MTGYRPASRTIAGMMVLVCLGMSISVMLDPVHSDNRAGGLACTGLAALVLRGAYRPRVRIQQDVLVVDQPLLRWSIPRTAVWAVRLRQGVIIVRCGTSFTIPYAFSSSIIANLINRDHHRTAAAKAIDAWRPDRVGGLRERPVRWSLTPALVDVVVLVGGWQVLYSLLLLL